MNIKEVSENYVAPITKNVADLDKIPINMDVKEKKAMDADGKEFSYMFIEVDNTEYRMPRTVIKQLQDHLKNNPDLTHFKVERKGTGLQTSYTVIPLKG